MQDDDPSFKAGPTPSQPLSLTSQAVTPQTAQIDPSGDLRTRYDATEPVPPGNVSTQRYAGSDTTPPSPLGESTTVPKSSRESDDGNSKNQGHIIWNMCTAHGLPSVPNRARDFASPTAPGPRPACL